MKSISLLRLNAVLLSVILFTIILYYGKAFLVPLFFSLLLVMLLLPVCRKLERLGVGRIWSTLIGMLIILAFVALLVGVIATQINSISDDLPKMQSNVEKMLVDIQNWVEIRYGISSREQISYAQKGINKISESGGAFFSSFFSGLMRLLTGFVLVLLYFFFLMWKREKYREFILKLVKPENKNEVDNEIRQISHVSGRYLIGRVVSMIFLAVVYMIGFSILGLENGVLIALVAVLPTIIPYVGAFVGGFFPVALAFVSGSPEMLVPILLILVLAQTFDNNLIEPLVEGESLDISPIFTIIAIVLGELIWGVAGMILFLPMFAILKIICNHIPSLSPYAFLLDNDMEEQKWVEKVKEWLRMKK